MRKHSVIILIMLVPMIVGIAVLIGLLSMWNKPLGPSLELPTQITRTSTLSPTSAAQGLDSTAVSTPTQAPTTAQISTPTQLPVTNAEPLCGGPAVMTILAIGSDERSPGYLYGLADTVRVVRIDFITPRVMMVDLPRDLWVEIPGIADHYGITHGKLNQAYFFGNPGMGYYDGPGEGPGLLARTLEVNFGLRVDHYLAIDMETFIGVIDAVNGVDIYVDTPIDLNEPGSTEDPALKLEVGTHHLDGELAGILARNRQPTTFQRALYQNMILRGLQNKVFSPSIIPELPNLIAEFSHSVQTDLSLNDINKLVCLGQALTEDNTVNVTFPEGMFTAGRVYDPYRNANTFIFEVDPEQMRAYMADFMNGTWPSP